MVRPRFAVTLAASLALTMACSPTGGEPLPDVAAIPNRTVCTDPIDDVVIFSSLGDHEPVSVDDNPATDLVRVEVATRNGDLLVSWTSTGSASTEGRMVYAAMIEYQQEPPAYYVASAYHDGAGWTTGLTDSGGDTIHEGGPQVGREGDRTVLAISLDLLPKAIGVVRWGATVQWEPLGEFNRTDECPPGAGSSPPSEWQLIPHPMG